MRLTHLGRTAVSAGAQQPRGASAGADRAAAHPDGIAKVCVDTAIGKAGAIRIGTVDVRPMSCSFSPCASRCVSWSLAW